MDVVVHKYSVSHADLCAVESPKQSLLLCSIRYFFGMFTNYYVNLAAHSHIILPGFFLKENVIILRYLIL
jgi:hypothetical protein